jgi:hypothetical protein
VGTDIKDVPYVGTDIKDVPYVGTDIKDVLCVGTDIKDVCPHAKKALGVLSAAPFLYAK